jgi:hypothetical protein
MQLDQVESTLIEVEGNTLGLGAGHWVTLRKNLLGDGDIFPFWDDGDFFRKYLVVGASYQLSINQLETGDVSDDEPFKARYWLLDSHTQFRPARRTAKPRMNGPQTALVVGPKGEEIWTDDLGRVVVQFDWDRLGERDQSLRAWCASRRCGQTATGARFTSRASGRRSSPTSSTAIRIDRSSPGVSTTRTTCRPMSCRPTRPKAASRVAAARAARPATSTRFASRTSRARKSCTSRPKRTCPRWSNTARAWRSASTARSRSVTTRRRPSGTTARPR